MPTRPLGRTGLRVSALGFGASPLGGVFADVDESECKRAVHRAIELGINFFDTSPFYGSTKSESVLGRCLEGIPRDKYVLATKVGRYGPNNFDFSAERVTKSVQESMKRLGVGYLDVVQCHDIEFGSIKQIVSETLPALQRLKEEGKIGAVGITGLPLRIFHEVMDQVNDGVVDVALSYCHCTLNDTSLTDGTLRMLQTRSVGVINASPFSMGLLTPGGPPTWHPAPEELKSCARVAAEHCSSRGMNLARAALQFSIRQEGVASTLVGMATVQEVEENVQAALESLNGDMMQAEVDIEKELINILAPVKNVTWPSGRPENN